MSKPYDFSGWATKYNILCSDGRVIRNGAFDSCHGKTIPIVYQHNHTDPDMVLGHADLECRPEGVYAYCHLNNSPNGELSKELIANGDINHLSIHANQLQQQGSSVLHGNIREVSLVLAGANPGATIDSVLLHGEYSDEDAIIFTDEKLELYHSDCEKPEQKKEEPKEEKKEMPNKEKTVQDVLDTFDEDQMTVFKLIVAKAIEYGQQHGSEEVEQSAMYEGYDMKHNIFESDEQVNNDELIHDGLNAIIRDGKRMGSMKESYLEHAGEYGITQIDWLFPEAKNLNNPPEFIKREDSWVAGVMSGVHRSPMSRIKSTFADITADEARARGYIKGKLKKEEVFTLLKRSTTPTTVYKKQKIDRDDQVDITDFDVISWIKGEMRMMLDEELARAFLVGDGRSSDSDDKINEMSIRPIWTDSDLFTIKKDVVVGDNATEAVVAKAIIKTAVKARKDYRGSGSPTFFTTEDVLTDMLLLEDLNGRVIYDDVNKLATAMRVSKIVTVPVMEGLTRTDTDSKKHDLLGIIVNLSDYNVGADKGGAVNMFDDFDIDYNQQKYLIETRCSGALTKPYSAIVIERPVTTNTEVQG